MKLFQKINLTKYVVLFLVLLGIIFIYIKRNNKFIINDNHTQVESSEISTKIAKPSFSIEGDTLTVVRDGSTTQILKADDSAIDNISSETFSLFILDKDFNFDGYNDIAMVSSVGYSGVNYFYEFYIYNTESGIFAKNPILEGEISNPEFDLPNKRIISSVRSGPRWYTQSFDWDGFKYVASISRPE